MTVVLDPDAAAVLKFVRDAGRPAYETLTADEARAYYLAARETAHPVPPAIASAVDTTIPGPAGAIPVRIYTPLTPRSANGVTPCLIFFHGGGWVIGDLDSHDVVCRTLAAEAELIVISVHYRLAPEHKFPAAYDDSIAATQWIAANAAKLKIDASKIIVGGDSAGGNLAAGVTFHAREHGLKLAGQLLIYPATDFRMSHPSHSEPETDCLLTHSVMHWFCDHYLNGPGDIDDIRASPARAASLKDLPPAYVMTAGADPLRDEGNEYATRLKADGVDVTFAHHPGQFHGFITMGKLLTKANAALTDMADWLKAR